MNEYTAHVQVPDSAIGAVLMYQLVDKDSVTMAAMRNEGGTWISFGVEASSDDAAVMTVAGLRYSISREEQELHALPEGYDSLRAFETAPLIITHGRTVIHSEGI